MIARLTGTLAETAADHAVIDVQGIGYQVQASSRTLDALRGTGIECPCVTVEFIETIVGWYVDYLKASQA